MKQYEKPEMQVQFTESIDILTISSAKLGYGDSINYTDIENIIIFK